MSDTAMTMPEKIWAVQQSGVGGCVVSFDTPSLDYKHPYVRADIAADLAQALRMAQLWLDIDGRYDMQGINAALARYDTDTQ